MQKWEPTNRLRWLFRGELGATLQQLFYCYEMNGNGMVGAKIAEEWRYIEVVKDDKEL
jgi:hypothetical protein